MAEKTLELRAGGNDDFVRWPIELPADDAWHQIHVILPVKLSKDKNTLYVGSATQPLSVFVDGEETQRIQL